MTNQLVTFTHWLHVCKTGNWQELFLFLCLSISISLCPGLAFCHCTPLSFWSLIVASGSKSQNALWNAVTAGIGIKDKDKRGILIDPRSPEEILADDLPSVDGPDAMEKTAIRFGGNHTLTHTWISQYGPISALDQSTLVLRWLLFLYQLKLGEWSCSVSRNYAVIMSHKVLCMFIFYS